MAQLEHQYAEAVTQRDYVGDQFRALQKELEKERRQSAEYLRRYEELNAEFEDGEEEKGAGEEVEDERSRRK